MNKLPLSVFMSLLFTTTARPQGSVVPSGTPGPTQKTLQQIEPRTDIQRTNDPLPTDANYHYIISTPGSYYLSANLAVTKTNGIHVTVPGVTIDLNGFEISRSSGSAGNGITIDLTAHRCTVRNGSIRGFANGVESVYSGTTSSQAGAYEQLVVSACSFSGLRAGEGYAISDCRAQENTGIGILGGRGNTIKGCTAAKNTDTGIIASLGSTLQDCATYMNGDGGFSLGDGSTMTNCTSNFNSGTTGIFGGAGSTITGCAVRGQDGGTAAFSYGIRSLSGSVVIGCTVSGTTSSAPTLTGNTGIGIYVDFGSLVKDCVVSANKGDGIQATLRCVVLQNHADLNGSSTGDGAGIHVTNSDNRIEGNNVTGNDRGLHVSGTSNLIFKNSAAGNSPNYEIVANNKVGVIVTTPQSLAISGNSGGSGVTTTDPWANFSF